MIFIPLGVPAIPMKLSLNPNPDDLTELEFSWMAPSDTLASVPLVYHPAITGLSFNISNMTTNMFVIFRDDTSLDCLQHDFSVFASNAAGGGLTASVSETIPIC